MKDNQAKYPQLRFKGFTDPWEQRKFKDILKTHSFRSYLAGVSENGEYEVIQQGDKPIVGYSDGEPFTDYKDVTLFGDHTVSLYKPKSPFFVATDGVKILSADNFEGDYLYTTLERYKPEPQGYKRHFTILKNQDVWFTENMEEQQKIGVFFKQLDDTITLHQRKLAKLKELKQGYLQKLFPKNGSKFPQLRFAGFADAWEQRKAAKIFKSISDKNHPELSVLSASQKLGMIHRDDIGIDIKYDKKSIAGYKRVEPGQFVIHLRSFQGGFAYANVEGITSPAYTVLDFVDKNENDPLFWRIVLTSTDFIKRLETVTYGIRDGRSISFADFSTLKFNVPTFEEQRTIGKFFKKIDLTITLHQRKLEKLQELKKGYLQKMFC